MDISAQHVPTHICSCASVTLTWKVCAQAACEEEKQIMPSNILLVMILQKRVQERTKLSDKLQCILSIPVGHKNGQLGQVRDCWLQGDWQFILIRTLIAAASSPLIADPAVLTDGDNGQSLEQCVLGEEEEEEVEE